MATATFPYTDSSLWLTGGWGQSGTKVSWGDGGQIDFRATSASASLARVDFSTSGEVLVSIDGGAPVAKTVTLFSALELYSLSEGARNVRITWVGRLDIYDDPCISLTGAAPALTESTETDIGKPYQPHLSQTAIQDDGTVDYSNAYALFQRIDASVRFNSLGSGSAVRAWCYLDGGKYAVSINQGAPIVATLPDDNAQGFVTLASGLTLQAGDEVRVSLVKGPNTNYLYTVMIVGGKIDTVAVPDLLPVHVFLGDSLCQAFEMPDSSQNYPYKVGRALNVAVVNLGASGALISQTGGQATNSIKQNALLAAAFSPAQVHVEGGHNDVGAAIALAEFQSQYEALLANLQAGTPGVPALCIPIPPSTDLGSSSLPYDVKIAAAVTAAGSPSVFGTGIGANIIPATDLQADGVHLLQSGAQKIADGIVAFLSPASGNALPKRISLGMRLGL